MGLENSALQSPYLNDPQLARITLTNFVELLAGAISDEFYEASETDRRKPVRLLSRVWGGVPAWISAGNLAVPLFMIVVTNAVHKRHIDLYASRRAQLQSEEFLTSLEALPNHSHLFFVIYRQLTRLYGDLHSAWYAVLRQTEVQQAIVSPISYDDGIGFAVASAATCTILHQFADKALELDHLERFGSPVMHDDRAAFTTVFPR